MGRADDEELCQAAWVPLAPVAPSAKDEEVEEAAVRALPKPVLPHVDAVVPCDTTGEFTSLTPEEHKKFIERGICEHSRELATAVDLPIIPHDIPLVADAYLQHEVIKDRADFAYIVVLKRSSGNLASTMKVLQMSQGPPNERVAHGEVVLPAPAGGCSGMIMASAHASPHSFTQDVTDLV